MWQLKKIAIGVGLIILFELLKMILSFKQSGATYYHFFSNLLSCYQILILLYCIITLFLELILKRFFKNNYKILSVGLFFILVLVCELLFGYLLHHPTSIPKGLYLFKRYYIGYEGNTIQFDKECSEYSNILFYKLKDQKQFVFRSLEFADSFTTNSKGFRDDEASLEKPSIIFLGDSYTLGWGAKQNETFVSVTENITGLKGLNAGMSSYGTARESMVLSTLDTSNLDFIIWQYCYNDAVENKAYSDSGFVLPVKSRKEYNRIADLNEWTTTYFPGKYFLTILNLVVQREEKKSANIPVAEPKHNNNAQEEAERFINILAKSKINWHRTRVIVLELSYRERHSQFITALQNLINQNPAKQIFLKNIFTLDVKTFLRKEDYYLMDVHLRKQGNFKVGEHLAKTIKSLQNK